MRKKLLIVEDDPGLQAQLKWCFTDCEVFLAADRVSALAALKQHKPQVMTLDLGIPPDAGGVSVGFEILKHVIAEGCRIKVIVVTGQEDREHALNAIKLGAYDFFNKPVDAQVLNLVVDRAFHLHQIEQENRALIEKMTHSPLDGIITSSDTMLRVCETVEKIAPSDLNVLILGESGTGKELIAKAIHQLSSYSAGEFVAINCAAIPENLLESELFGHEKGSFTGAHTQKKGKIEIANGGTLFLDEIGDMPFNLQAKMLRFLQERVIERVGGTKLINVDTRIVCATHQPIEEMISEKSFREDLYYRISDVVLKIPPLRDREEDVMLLARVFANRYSEQQEKEFSGFSLNAEMRLVEYEFKGNVRELEKIIRRAVIMSEGSLITSRDLQLDIVVNKEADSDDFSKITDLNLNHARARIEKLLINRAMVEAQGNLSQAAKLLGISRPTLYSLMSKQENEAD